MKRYAVYTVVTGGYDNVMQPLVTDERFDYILFSEGGEDCGLWRGRRIPFEAEDSLLRSRYPKMHPGELLPDYEATLYMDANLQITDDSLYDRVIKALEAGCDWASVSHPFRDCIYDEAFEVMASEKADESRVISWCHYLRHDGFPRHYGLYENNMILRRNNERVKAFDRLWWETYLHSPSRDQLSLMYLMWKCGAVSERGPYTHAAPSRDFDTGSLPGSPSHHNVGSMAIRTGLLLPEGESAWKSACVRRVEHSSSAVPYTVPGSMTQMRSTCRRNLPLKGLCRKMHYRLYALPPACAGALLFIWGILAALLYVPLVLLPGRLRRFCSDCLILRKGRTARGE